MRHLLPLLLVACATTDDATTDDTDTDTDAVPTTAEGWLARWQADGPWTVGYRESSLTYDDPASGEDRTLRLVAWYPTETEGGPTATYRGLTGPWADDDALDAPEAAPGAFPLAVFSHGHQGDVDNATWMMAWLASHGWIVVAPEHTGNAGLLSPDRTTEIYVQRPLDISATVDHVLDGRWSELPDTDGRLLGLGHSFGGYTMYVVAGAGWDVDHWATACETDTSAFCSTWDDDLADLMRAGAADDRFDAVITLSGGNWDQLREDGLATVDTPLLQVTGGLDSSVPNEGVSDPIWRDLPDGERIRVDIAHGDHQTYNDTAGISGIPGTSPDAVDPERGFAILQAYLGAWASREVLGHTEGLDPILDGSLQVDEEVTVSLKP